MTTLTSITQSTNSTVALRCVGLLTLRYLNEQQFTGTGTWETFPHTYCCGWCDGLHYATLVREHSWKHTACASTVPSRKTEERSHVLLSQNCNQRIEPLRWEGGRGAASHACSVCSKSKTDVEVLHQKKCVNSKDCKGYLSVRVI